MLYTARGGVKDNIPAEDLAREIGEALTRLGERRRVLVVPPDFTRFHSRSGEITQLVHRHYGSALEKVLIASGTHRPMTDDEIRTMFGDVPRRLFVDHDFRKDVATLGVIESSFIKEASEGACDWPYPAQVNRLIAQGDYDLILSIGQVVPHEVTGMANYTKNLLVGTGGAEAINKSHFLGAVYGMERMMGRADTPVRRVLNEAARRYLNNKPIVYILTVMGCDECGRSAMKGLFIGNDDECFLRAASLSVEVNFQQLDRPLDKAVVRLDPTEYKSAWLCNKAIYRTRMAMADGGTLVILAPGMKEFGEDPEIDRLIRRYGYKGTPATLAAVRDNDDIRANLSAAAHLIHGSSEGRFSIIYCPGNVSREDIEAAGYEFGELADMLEKYDPEKLKDGYNTLPDGEEIYYISQPAQGLWAYKGCLTDR